MSAPWTYEGYWATVIGADRDAARTVEEFDLESGDVRGLREWLGEAEAAAWAEGGHGKPFPEEWSDYNERAVEELQAAARSYVVETRPLTGGEWRTEGIGENEPRSREECEEACRVLPTIGGDWATHEYRIREVKS